VKRLAIPQALTFTLLGGAATTAVVTTACKDDPPASDAMTDTGFCFRPCETITDGTPCAAQPCIDDQGMCPNGCRPEPIKYYCIPDGTDAGVCPEPAQCILEGDMCPAGCTPVG